MQPRVYISCALAGLLAVAAWMWNGIPTTQSTKTPTPPVGSTTQTDEEPITVVPASPAVSPSAPPDTPNIASYASTSTALPPKNAPLRNTFAELSQRARDGDNIASCRLAADLWRCSQLPLARSIDRSALSEAARAAPQSASQERAIEQAAAIRNSLSDDETLCLGFDQPSTHAAWDYLLLAAERGNLQAMTQLAVAPPLDRNAFLRDVEQWQRYREVAGTFLQRAADAGEPLALYNLWWALAGYPVPGGEPTIPPDPYMARVRAYALLSMGDARTVRTIQNYFTRTQGALTPAQEAQAQAEGQAMAADHFPNVKEAGLTNFPPRDEHCIGTRYDSPKPAEQRSNRDTQ